MDLSKYDNDGFGLSREAFTILFEVLEELESPSVLEFGSGISTQFLYNYWELSGKRMIIDSLDDSERWKHQAAVLTPLVECSYEDFNRMFKDKKIHNNLFKQKKTPPTTRQRNCFYDLSNIQLKHYDLVILDGPNGNGRSLAFLHLIGHLNEGAIILIDDTVAADGDFKYDFCGRFNSVFDAEELAVHEESNENSFRVYKVKEVMAT